MTKVVITGGNKFVGLWISDFFKANHNVVSISRSTGHDLNDAATFDSVLKHTDDADIFVNNAHVGSSQIQLLESVFAQWRYQSKWILNIGALDFNDEIWSLVSPEYRQEKQMLTSLIAKLQLLEDRKCRLTHLKLGVVDTENCQPLNVPKIQKNELHSALEYLCNSNSTNEVRELGLGKLV